MVKPSGKHDRLFRFRTPSVYLVPSIALLVFMCFRIELHRVDPLTISKWTHAKPSESFLGFNSGKRCALVAMIITSEADYQNGTMNAWFDTLPKRQEDLVCCVSIRRSTTTAFDYQQSSTSCDTLFVPMVREDQYLTISEKVHLAFSQIASRYDFKWLLKTDADSFVCFSRMLNLLQNYDPDGVTHLGYAESRNILIEDPGHKWYDPSMTDIVHNARQPVVSGTGLYHPYMQGAGYLLSRGAMEIIRTSLPRLRYSPMEDAMVGSWVLAFNAHWAVLNLDLRARIQDCLIPDNFYISHYRKGPKALGKCMDVNKQCAELSEVKEVSLGEVSFLITSHMHIRGNQALDLYGSIRAIFPTNEVVFGDISASDEFMNRLLTRMDDPNLHGYSFPDMKVPELRNTLVNLANGAYVCVLQDVQRLSWETMIGNMLRPVETGRADISAGFLVFNPHMMTSSIGRIQYGYNLKQDRHWLSQIAIIPNITDPNEFRDIHGSSGFLLAKKSFLQEHPWRNFGPFSEDEFYMRLFRQKARVQLVNSGVRHGYHYPISNITETFEEVRDYAPKICAELYLMQERERSTKLYGRNITLDCVNHTFKRDYENANLTSLNRIWKWA